VAASQQSGTTETEVKTGARELAHELIQLAKQRRDRAQVVVDRTTEAIDALEQTMDIWNDEG